MRKRLLIGLGIAITLVLVVLVIVIVRSTTPASPAQQAANMLRELPQHRWENLSTAAQHDYPFLKNQTLPTTAAIEPDTGSFDTSNRDPSAAHRWDAIMTYSYSSDGKTFHAPYIALLKQENGSWHFYGYTGDFDPRNVNTRGELLRNEAFDMLLTKPEAIQTTLYQIQVARSAAGVKNGLAQVRIERFLADPYGDAVNTVLPTGIRFDTDVKTYRDLPEQGKFSITAKASYATGGDVTYQVLFDEKDGKIAQTVPLNQHGARALTPTALFANTDSAPANYTTALTVYDDIRKLAGTHSSYITRFYADLIARADKEKNLTPDQQAQVEQWRQQLANDPLRDVDLYPVPVTWKQTDAQHGTMWMIMQPYDKAQAATKHNVISVEMVLDPDNIWRIRSFRNP